MKLNYHIAVSLILGIGFCWINPNCSAFQNETAEQSAAPATDEAPTTEDASDSTQDQDREPFFRLQTDEFGDPVALQTATARYVLLDDSGKEKLEVVLESVVHIADSSYYRGFQKRFARYDSVLFESIIKPADKGSSAESQPSGFDLLQQLSTGTLGLAYQFDEIDYEAVNMLNSDLTMTEIMKRMGERGESNTTLFSDLVAQLVKKVKLTGNEPTASDESTDNAPSDDSPQERAVGLPFDFSVLTDPDGIMKIRRLMAGGLVESGLLESAFSPSIHKMVIGDRNDHAISVLDQEIEAGNRKIAIFYGVGHMADLERRLLNDYGMKKVAVNWRNAWDLRDGAIEGAPLEGLIESTFRDSFKNKLRQFAKGVTDKRKEKEREEADLAKDAKISAMEKALKALEARLNEAEKDKKDKKDDSGNSEGDQSSQSNENVDQSAV